MWVLTLRIMKNGLLTAALLAVLGYLMAEAALFWVATQPAPTFQPRLNAENPSDEAILASPDLASLNRLRYQMPFQMAFWGFGLVVLIELILAYWRQDPLPTPPSDPLRPPSDQEVEDLLNQLLQQAEAAEAARKSPRPAGTPSSVACPQPRTPDNSPMPN